MGQVETAVNIGIVESADNKSVPVVQISGTDAFDFRQKATEATAIFLSDFLVAQTGSSIVLVYIGRSGDRGIKNYSKNLGEAVEKADKILKNDSDSPKFSLHSDTRVSANIDCRGLGLSLKGKPSKYAIEEFNEIFGCDSPNDFLQSLGVQVQTQLHK